MAATASSTALSGDDLRPLLRRGLPADARVVPERVLMLPGVTAQAATGERVSRVAAFDALLRTLLARFPDQRLAAAAQALFGLSLGMAGATLTARRSAAAVACGREAHHFRKHLEPRILDQLAAAVAADSDGLVIRQAVAPVLLPAAGPTALPPEVFAWEVTEQAEQLARLWSGVYALRAELLACQRLASMDPCGPAVTEAAQHVLWHTARLHAAVAGYRRAYGNRLLHAQVPPGALVALAGWAPPLTDQQITLVCRYVPDSHDERTFTRRLSNTPEGARLRQEWVTAFGACDTTKDFDTTKDQERTSW
jgi:hypothetical protein